MILRKGQQKSAKICYNKIERKRGRIYTAKVRINKMRPKEPCKYNEAKRAMMMKCGRKSHK